MKSSLTEKWLVCRVCLQQPHESMKTIFSHNTTQDLTAMMLACGGVPIKPFDHFPDKICNRCYKYLTIAHKFRVLCQRSFKHLSRFIAPVEVDKASNEEEVLEIGTDVEEYDCEEVEYRNEDNEDSIKQEMEEYEEDGYGDIYEPMKDETADEEDILKEEILEEEEEEDLDEDQNTVSEIPADYLEEVIDDEFSSSDEEFIPQSQIKQTRKRTSGKRVTVRKFANQSSGLHDIDRESEDNISKNAKKEPRTKAAKKDKKEKRTSFICDVCGNIYRSQGRLTEHIKVHLGLKPHVCEICNHAFAQTQQLARHMNTHTGNRPYKCNYCSSAFADLSTRNKHHRIHTNERPYVCDVCGKTFTYTNTLKFHKMIHTGEKPFVCEICGKGFNQSYKLRNHKVTHEKKGVKMERLDVETMPNYQDVNIVAAQLLEI